MAEAQWSAILLSDPLPPDQRPNDVDVSPLDRAQSRGTPSRQRQLDPVPGRAQGQDQNERSHEADAPSPRVQNELDHTRPAQALERRVHVGTQAALRNSAEHYGGNSVSTTKYRLWNIVPKNLYEQFHRVANIWFLVVSIFQLLPLDLSPTSQYATIVPLCCVLFVTFLKDAYEDNKRRRDDARVNSQRCLVIREVNTDQHHLPHLQVVETEWRSVKVGDFVRLETNQAVPADVVLLSCSSEDGVAFVDTAQLDGETSLKPKNALQETQHLGGALAQIALLQGRMDVEHPNELMNSFNGTFFMRGVPRGCVVTSKNLLLRGSTLRNTRWALGLTVYTGADTKLVRNLAATPSKRSCVEVTSNKLLGIIFAVLVMLAGISALLSWIWYSQTPTGTQLQWAVANESAQKASGIFLFITFMIGYNNLIPISLYVSLDMVRGFQGLLMEQDPDMFHDKTSSGCKVRNSNLNDNLGQVEFVLTDKTGTLTENQMKFKACSVAGHIFGSWDALAGPVDRVTALPPASVCNPLAPDLQPLQEQLAVQNIDREKEQTIEQFFLCLALCHGAIREPLGGHDVASAQSGPELSSSPQEVEQSATPSAFKSASPDEEALLDAARDYGFEFKSRGAGRLVISVRGEDQAYDLLFCNEFSSQRKRMSVLVQRVDPDSDSLPMRIRSSVDLPEPGNENEAPESAPSCWPSSQYPTVLYMKGADNVMLERIDWAIQNSGRVRLAQEHLAQFSSHGLRTLVCGRRVLDDEEREYFRRLLNEAQSSITDREARLEIVGNELEEDLDLLGVTAIEDRIQPGVPQTVGMLLNAGIKVWMLTGDNMDTAINIGLACQLIDSSMRLHRISSNSNTVSVSEVNEMLRAAWENVLEGLRERPPLKHCVVLHGTVLYTIMAQENKASLVSLVRNSVEGNPLTLAIGDGGNDVAMIQAAHVGIGLLGVEGRQAANASDFTIGQFRFLQQLLFVHGRRNLRRTGIIIGYSFYKNFVLVLPLAFFAPFAGFSGTTLYDSYLLSSFNLLFTSLPILIAGSFDFDVQARLALMMPSLYQLGIEKKYLNWRMLLGWIFEGVLHAIFIFVMLLALFGLAVSTARVSELLTIGSWAFGTCILVVSTTLLLHTQVIMDWQFGILLLSILLYPALLFLYSSSRVANLVNPSMVGVAPTLLSDPSLWLGTLLVVVACVAASNARLFTLKEMWPDLSDMLLEVQQSKGRKSAGRGNLAASSQRASGAAWVDPKMRHEDTFMASRLRSIPPKPPRVHKVLPEGCVGLRPVSVSKKAPAADEGEAAASKKSVSPEEDPFLMTLPMKLSDRLNMWGLQLWRSQWVDVTVADLAGRFSQCHALQAGEHFKRALKQASARVSSAVLGNTTGQRAETPRTNTLNFLSRGPGGGTAVLAEGHRSLRDDGRRGAAEQGRHSALHGRKCNTMPSLLAAASSLNPRSPSETSPAITAQCSGDPGGVSVQSSVGVDMGQVRSADFGGQAQPSSSTDPFSSGDASAAGSQGPENGDGVNSPSHVEVVGDGVQPDPGDAVPAEYASSSNSLNTAVRAAAASPNHADVGDGAWEDPGSPAIPSNRNFVSEGDGARSSNLLDREGPVKIRGILSTQQRPKQDANQMDKAVVDTMRYSILTLRFQSLEQEGGFKTFLCIQGVRLFQVVMVAISLAVLADNIYHLITNQTPLWLAILVIVLILALTGLTLIAVRRGLLEHNAEMKFSILVFVAFVAKNMYDILTGHSGLLVNLLLPVIFIKGARVRFTHTFIVLAVQGFIALVRYWLLCSTISTMPGCDFFTYDAPPLQYLVWNPAVILLSMVCTYQVEVTLRKEYAAVKCLTESKFHAIELLQGMLPIAVVLHVLRRLGQSPSAELKQLAGLERPLQTMHEDRGIVTVLFCDICDFDDIVETLSPDQLVHVLDRCFALIDRVSEQNGLQKIETVGKTYMAAAMPPDSPNSSTAQHTEDALRTILAAIGILQKVSTKSIGMTRRVTRVTLQLGAHTGPVISGVVGERKPQFALFGDTVNTASRMQSTGKAGFLHISNSTYQLVKDDARFKWIQRKTAVKGKGMMDTFLLRRFQKEVHAASVPRNAYGGSAASNFSAGASVSHAHTPNRELQFSSVQEDENAAEGPSGQIEEPMESVVGKKGPFERASGLRKKATRFLKWLHGFVLPGSEAQVFDMAPQRTSFLVFLLCYCVESAVILNGTLWASPVAHGVSIAMRSLYALGATGFYIWLVLSRKLKADLGWVASIIIFVGFCISFILGWLLAPSFAAGKSDISWIVLEFFFFVFVQMDFSRMNPSSLVSAGLLAVQIVALLVHALVEQPAQTAIVSFIMSIIIIGLYIVVARQDAERCRGIAVKVQEYSSISELLDSMLPFELVEEMKTGSLSLAYHYEGMNFLFADIVGFTSFCASHTPEEAVNLVTTLFAAFDKKSVQLGVYKVCTIGDAYVVVNEPKLTSPRNRQDESRKVFLMALAMLTIINEVRAKVNFPDLDMRIGLHFGNFVGGVIGTQRLRFDIWGEDVLIGNKIESHGIAGKICASGSSVEALQLAIPGIVFEFKEEIALKTAFIPSFKYIQGAVPSSHRGAQEVEPAAGPGGSGDANAANVERWESSGSLGSPHHLSEQGRSGSNGPQTPGEALQADDEMDIPSVVSPVRGGAAVPDPCSIPRLVPVAPVDLE